LELFELKKVQIERTILMKKFVCYGRDKLCKKKEEFVRERISIVCYRISIWNQTKFIEKRKFVTKN